MELRKHRFGAGILIALGVALTLALQPGTARAAPDPTAAEAVAPDTATQVSASPNPAVVGAQVAFHWNITGFPSPSLVRCNDNKGWLVNAPYTGTVYKYAAADFTSSFTWTVTCSDGDFDATGSVAVTLDATGAFETGDDASKGLDAYDSHNPDCAAGRRRAKWAKVKYWQSFHLYTYWTYYEEVRFCWNSAHTKVTYFWRDRWTGDTNLGWDFDGNIYTSCGPVDAEHCSGKVGAYSETAVTQGHYHVIVHGGPFAKYPWISITAHGDGGALASWRL